jgi:hypothetical protein
VFRKIIGLKYPVFGLKFLKYPAFGLKCLNPTRHLRVKTIKITALHVTSLYLHCAWCEMPLGVSSLSAKPKPSSCFGWLFILILNLNIPLDINDVPGLAALYHRSN